MRPILMTVAFCLMIAPLTNAAQATTDATGLVQTPANRNLGKSPKKAKANAVNLTPPQVLEDGDTTIGLRANQGGIYEGSPLMGLNIERMVKPNFGVNATVGYSSFSNKIEAGPYSAQIDSTVWIAVLSAAFHADLFKVKNLDTYLSLGFGHAFINTEVKSNDMDFAPASISSGGATNFFVAYLGARYFIDSSWAFTASLGTGLGTMGLGVDYLF